MKKRPIAACAGWFLAASTALAAPPQPQLTSAANDIKQLRFNWSPSAGATGYELWFQSNSAAAETRFYQLPASRTSVANNVAVHLLDWTNARYWLKACDSTGCSSSAKVSVLNHMAGTIGLFM